MGKKRKKIWLAAPLCLFCNLWRARNRLLFENKVLSAQRIKANFVSNLWTWANMYSVDNTHSVLEFLTWLGSRYVFLGLFFFVLSVFWFPFVHDPCTLGFFCYLYNFLFIDQKKKKMHKLGYKK